jgi:hypothetical protein
MRNGAVVGFALGVWLALALVIGFASMLLVVALGIAGAIVGVALTSVAFGARERPRRPAAGWAKVPLAGERDLAGAGYRARR